MFVFVGVCACVRVCLSERRGFSAATCCSLCEVECPCGIGAMVRSRQVVVVEVDVAREVAVVRHEWSSLCAIVAGGAIRGHSAATLPLINFRSVPGPAVRVAVPRRAVVHRQQNGAGVVPAHVTAGSAGVPRHAPAV